MFFAMLLLAAQAVVIPDDVQPLAVTAVTITVDGKDYPVRMSANERYRIRRDKAFTMTLEVKLAKGVANPCPDNAAKCRSASEFVLTGDDGTQRIWSSDKAEAEQVSFERGYTFSFACGPIHVPDDIITTGAASMEWRFTKGGNEFFAYIVRLEFSAP